MPKTDSGLHVVVEIGVFQELLDEIRSQFGGICDDNMMEYVSHWEPDEKEPDSPEEWSFSADLRCFGFETNYDVSDSLREAGVYGPEDNGVSSDNEMACCYTYFTYEEAARQFMFRFRAWAKDQMKQISEKLAELKAKAKALDPLDGSIEATPEHVVGLANGIGVEIARMRLSRRAKVSVRIDGVTKRVKVGRTELIDGEQHLVLEG